MHVVSTIKTCVVMVTVCEKGPVVVGQLLVTLVHEVLIMLKALSRLSWSGA